MDKKEIKIIEIGACSLLDFDIEDFHPQIELNWSKIYNKNMPRYKTRAFPITSVLTANVLPQDPDVIIWSMGNKGDRKKLFDLNSDEIMNLFNANIGTPLKILNRILSMRYTHRPLKLILLNSVAGEPEGKYPNHAMYSMMKAAMHKMYDNILEEYKDKNGFEVFNLTIPYTQSRMTGGQGEEPLQVQKAIMDIVFGIGDGDRFK
jgi:NAD(P)-dependent dehydrogenase (short-subunit alcohol dehydrogenase family)